MPPFFDAQIALFHYPECVKIANIKNNRPSLQDMSGYWVSKVF